MSAFHAQSHRVLVIPELLDMIFSFLDDIDNASNAQVCTLWSTVALDVIWKEPSNLHRLFSMLVPLVLVEGYSEYVFEHLPTSADWRRFDRYASRVRKLVYSPQNQDSAADSHVQQIHNSNSPFGTSPLSRRIFDDIARTRTRMDIFPNLHTLVWMPYTYNRRAHKRDVQGRQLLDIANTMKPMHVFPWDGVVFMHSRVKTFAFYLPGESERGMEHVRPRPGMSLHGFMSARSHFLSDVASRMPALRTLDVRTSLRASAPSALSPSSSHATLAPNSSLSLVPLTPPTPQLQDDLGALLLSLPTLHKLILPRFFFTTRIAEAAARVPNLGVVEFQYLASQGCGWAGDVFPPSGGFAPDFSSFDSGSSSSVASKSHVVSPTIIKPVTALGLFTGTSASAHQPTSPPTSSSTHEEGPFQALYDLSLTSTFADLSAFLDSPYYNPSRLTSIYVDSACVVETNRDLGKLARMLLENCGMLRYVALVSMRDPGLVRSHAEVENEDANGPEPMLGPGRDVEEAENDTIDEIERENPYITLPTILPLLALPLLTSLELTHAWPLGLSLSDIATVASNLPGLETLLLNTEPVHLYLPISSPLHHGRPSSSSGGTERAINVPGLEVLSVVARRCRLLRHFGVFLDATGVGELISTAARRLRQVGGGDGSVPPSPVKRALRALPFNMDSESEGEHEDTDATALRDTAVDSLPSPVPALSLSFSAASPTFSAALARLSLGVSAISDGDADAAALYLSHVLPLGCVIDFGVTWDDGLAVSGSDGVGGGGEVPPGDEDMEEDMDDDDGDADLDAAADTHAAPAPDLAAGHGHGHSHTQQPVSAALRAHRTHSLHLTVQARCAVWDRVAAQVPLLARLRQEERARTRAMERELEALRAREDRRAREKESGLTFGHLGDGMSSGGEGVRMNLAAAAATRKKSWLNLKDLGREWLHL